MGHMEDLLSIKGSRAYVTSIIAPIVEAILDSWSHLERAVAAVTADAALLDEGADDAADVTPMAVESADGVKVEAVAVEVDAAVAEEVRPTKVQ